MLIRRMCMVHMSFYIAARRNLVHGIGPTKGSEGGGLPRADKGLLVNEWFWRRSVNGNSFPCTDMLIYTYSYRNLRDIYIY